MTEESAAATLASGRSFLTFGGVETHLIFDKGVELREFAAFEVLDDEAAWRALEDEFFFPTMNAALAHGHGMLVDCLVWRASPDYVAKLGRKEGVAALNRRAVDAARRLVADWRARSGSTRESCPIVLTADLGPRGDGYKSSTVTADAAAKYHDAQVRSLADAGAEMLAGWTMTGIAEAVGLCAAAREHGLPIVVSPTVETDGRLPDGSSLGEFIQAVDEASGSYPLFFMANCAHPTHIGPMLAAARRDDPSWLPRFKGLRANASTRSHEELDNSTALDRGDPLDLGRRVAALKNAHDLVVLGGCCGTDVPHLLAIAEACA